MQSLAFEPFNFALCNYIVQFLLVNPLGCVGGHLPAAAVAVRNRAREGRRGRVHSEFLISAYSKVMQ